MRLIKRLIELAFFVFLLSLFGKNMDVSVAIKYYGLQNPITIHFWELVLFCVAFGIIIAAMGDFVTQLKWMGERRRLLKTDKGHAAEVESLNERIRELEAENQRTQRELEQKTKELEKKSPELQRKPISPGTGAASPDLTFPKPKGKADAEDPFEKAKPQTAPSGMPPGGTTSGDRS